MRQKYQKPSMEVIVLEGYGLMKELTSNFTVAETDGIDIFPEEESVRPEDALGKWHWSVWDAWDEKEESE